MLEIRLSEMLSAYYRTLIRIVAQAISRRLPTAAARVRAWGKPYRVCDGKSDAGAGFLPVLPFPMSLIHSTNCSKMNIIYHQGLLQ
jgi:hypothetical protein